MCITVLAFLKVKLSLTGLPQMCFSETLGFLCLGFVFFFFDPELLVLGVISK